MYSECSYDTALLEVWPECAGSSPPTLHVSTCLAPFTTRTADLSKWNGLILGFVSRYKTRFRYSLHAQNPRSGKNVAELGGVGTEMTPRCGLRGRF